MVRQTGNRDEGQTTWNRLLDSYYPLTLLGVNVGYLWTNTGAEFHIYDAKIVINPEGKYQNSDEWEDDNSINSIEAIEAHEYGHFISFADGSIHSLLSNIGPGEVPSTISAITYVSAKGTGLKNEDLESNKNQIGYRPQEEHAPFWFLRILLKNEDLKTSLALWSKSNDVNIFGLDMSGATSDHAQYSLSSGHYNPEGYSRRLETDIGLSNDIKTGILAGLRFAAASGCSSIDKKLLYRNIYYFLQNRLVIQANFEGKNIQNTATAHVLAKWSSYESFIRDLETTNWTTIAPSVFKESELGPLPILPLVIEAVLPDFSPSGDVATPDILKTASNQDSTNNNDVSFGSSTIVDSSETTTSSSSEIVRDDIQMVRIDVTGMTIWDIFSKFSDLIPDFETICRPFENRTTLFFGRPRYLMCYKYRDCTKVSPSKSNGLMPDGPTLIEDGIKREDREHISCYTKPLMQAHPINSKTIISNDIICTSRFLSNAGIPVDAKGKTYPGFMVHVDANILPAHKKIAYVNTKLFGPGWWDSFLAATVGIFWPGIDTETYKFDDMTDVARGWLKDSMREMYQGTITTLGMPAVNTFHICNIFDRNTLVNGNFEVGSVTHSFTSQGFTTTIKPNLVCDLMDTRNIVTNQLIAMMGLQYNTEIEFIEKDMLAQSVVNNLLNVLPKPEKTWIPIFAGVCGAWTRMSPIFQFLEVSSILHLSIQKALGMFVTKDGGMIFLAAAKSWKGLWKIPAIILCGSEAIVSLFARAMLVSVKGVRVGEVVRPIPLVMRGIKAILGGALNKSWAGFVKGFMGKKESVRFITHEIAYLNNKMGNFTFQRFNRVLNSILLDAKSPLVGADKVLRFRILKEINKLQRDEKIAAGTKRILSRLAIFLQTELKATKIEFELSKSISYLSKFVDALDAKLLDEFLLIDLETGATLIDEAGLLAKINADDTLVATLKAAGIEGDDVIKVYIKASKYTYGQITDAKVISKGVKAAILSSTEESTKLVKILASSATKLWQMDGISLLKASLRSLKKGINIPEIALMLIGFGLRQQAQGLKRTLDNLVSLTMSPLKIGCAEWTAGIDGHMGSVLGDSAKGIQDVIRDARTKYKTQLFLTDVILGSTLLEEGPNRELSDLFPKGDEIGLLCSKVLKGRNPELQGSVDPPAKDDKPKNEPCDPPKTTEGKPDKDNFYTNTGGAIKENIPEIGKTCIIIQASSKMAFYKDNRSNYKLIHKQGSDFQVGPKTLDNLIKKGKISQKMQDIITDGLIKEGDWNSIMADTIAGELKSKIPIPIVSPRSAASLNTFTNRKSERHPSNKEETADISAIQDNLSWIQPCVKITSNDIAFFTDGTKIDNPELRNDQNYKEQVTGLQIGLCKTVRRWFLENSILNIVIHINDEQKETFRETTDGKRTQVIKGPHIMYANNQVSMDLSYYIDGEFRSNGIDALLLQGTVENSNHLFDYHSLFSNAPTVIIQCGNAFQDPENIDLLRMIQDADRDGYYWKIVNSVVNGIVTFLRNKGLYNEQI